MKLEGIKAYQANNFINCHIELGFIKEEDGYCKFLKIDTNAAWTTITPGTAAYCLKFLSYEVFKIYCYLKYEFEKYMYNHRNDLFNDEPYLFSYSSIAKAIGKSPTWQPNIDKIRLGIKTLISLGLIDCGEKRYIKSIETKNGKVVPVKFIALYSVNEYSEPQKKAAEEITIEEYNNMDHSNKIMYTVSEVLKNKQERIEVKDVKVLEESKKIDKTMEQLTACTRGLHSGDYYYDGALLLWHQFRNYFNGDLVELEVDDYVREVCVSVFGKDYCDALVENS